MSNSTEHFIPLADAEVPEEYLATLATYRRLAQEHGVPETTPLVWRVRSGFTLKSHAPKAGPCFEGFRYTQGWYFKDEPTKDGLVFWVPRLLDGSTSRNPNQHLDLLVGTRRRLKLPNHHLTSFGSVALLAGLILAHLRATGERVPVGAYATRTDTYHFDGRHLLLRWEGSGLLYCSSWYPWGHNLVGVYALGVENDS